MTETSPDHIIKVLGLDATFRIEFAAENENFWNPDSKITCKITILHVCDYTLAFVDALPASFVDHKHRKSLCLYGVYMNRSTGASFHAIC